MRDEAQAAIGAGVDPFGPHPVHERADIGLAAPELFGQRDQGQPSFGGAADRIVHTTEGRAAPVRFTRGIRRDIAALFGRYRQTPHHHRQQIAQIHPGAGLPGERKDPRCHDG